MNFDFKIKLIGYYTGEKQNMNPEKRFQDEAEKLAELLERTFAETFSSIDTDKLGDKRFVESLSSNTVYIFKDEDKNLYAYYPTKQIARLSSVIYDSNNINKTPFEYSSWFLPGEKIPYIPSNEKKQNNRHARIALCDINGNDFEFTNKEFFISTAGSDFLIHLKRKSYALDWNPDTYISIKDLEKIIRHKWTYLDETDTDDGCGDCDGYNYDNCDYSRCKNDCEHCGGRRYICNNGCFYYRYDTYVSIEFDEDIINEDLAEGFGILRKIGSQYSKHTELIKQHGEYLNSLNNECQMFLGYNLWCEPVISYIKTYKQMLELEKERNNSSHVVDILLMKDGKVAEFKLPDNAIKIGRCGFLWLSNKLVLDGYDFVSDTFIKQEYTIKPTGKADEKAFKQFKNNISIIDNITFEIKDGKAKINI